MELIEEKLDPSFVRELHKIVKNYDTYLEKKNLSINYINLYQKNLNINKYNYLLDYIKKVEHIKKDLERTTILYYGFIISQPGNSTQHFHLDYRGQTLTYFIPLCELTDKNGTEFLYFYDESNYSKYFNVFNEITHKYINKDELIEFLKTINLTYLKDYEFRIANSQANRLIRMTNYVFHRGKTNESDNRRIMFQLTLELKPVDFIQNMEFIEIAEEDEIYLN